MEYVLILLIVTFIAFIGNSIYTGIGLMESLPGIIILMLIAMAGITLEKLIPLPIPTIIYITVIGVLLAMPYSPTSEVVGTLVGKVEMLPLATPVLAYAGVSMGKDWVEFKKISWRGILLAACVMIGTFLGSAVVSHIILSIQGII